MKELKKVVHNKIIAKTALAAVSIAVMASLMGKNSVDAYTVDSVLQEQDGVVVVYEWHRITTDDDITDFIHESYYNPTPLMITPYDISMEKPSGQPISLYADSDHVKARAGRPTALVQGLMSDKEDNNDNSVLSTWWTASNGSETAKKMDYSIVGDAETSFFTNNHSFDKFGNSYVSNRSMVLVNGMEEDTITYYDLYSDMFYTGGNCRGCLWFSSVSDKATTDRYDGFSVMGAIALSEPDTKTKYSAAMTQESIIQNKVMGNDSLGFITLRGYGISGRIKADEMVKSCDYNPAFHYLYLDDTDEMTDGCAHTYLGLANADKRTLAVQNIHFGNQDSNGYRPLIIYGNNYAKRSSDGARVSADMAIYTASASTTGRPQGATMLAYDNGIMYGYNAYAGTYSWTEKLKLETIIGDVTLYSEDHTATVTPHQAIRNAVTNARKEGRLFTTMYVGYYGVQRIFTAFKGETNEISADGRPTTIISGIRTVGGTEYEDENGGIIKTEGEILCEGSTIIVPEGAVLSVDGNFINNGKIEVLGGTLIIKDGGVISQFGDTNEGCIVCGQGDSGEAGQIIVMPGGKLLCTSTITTDSLMNAARKTGATQSNISPITIQPGLVMNAGASLVNYGDICVSSITLDSRSVIENKKGAALRAGYYNKKTFTFLAGEDNYLDKMEFLTTQEAKKKVANTLSVTLSYNLAAGKEEEVVATRAAIECMNKYFKDYSSVKVVGEGKAVIVTEDPSDEIKGFVAGGDLEIKTTEY